MSEIDAIRNAYWSGYMSRNPEDGCPGWDELQKMCEESWQEYAAELKQLSRVGQSHQQEF